MSRSKIFLISLGIIWALASWSGAPPMAAENSSETDTADHFIYPEFSQKISMDFKDANLIDVLKILSQQSGLNFIGSQEVANKRITLFLKDVPVEEALERILTAHGLGYELDSGSGIFIVKTLDRPVKNTITRIYRLKHASVGSSKITKTLTIEAGGGGAGAASSSGGTSTTIGLVAALRTVMTTGASIVEDPRTNSLIITDNPSQFPLIEQTLAKLDVPIPQILIEVEMLDVSKNLADLIGVKFGATPLTFTGAQREHLYPWNQNQLLDKGLADDPAYTVGTINASGLEMTLQFLETDSKTKNLARPRILTLNNETAEIKISTNEAIGVTQEATSTGGSTGTTTVEAERVETGVFLTVTPQANLLTGEITMAIAPRVIQARQGATFQGQTFKDPEERGTQSILKVNNGDTIILGGLVRSDKTTIINKVPFLGDIPVLGRAFRHNDESEVERELIIFITPHILAEENVESALKTKEPYQPLSREQEIPARRKQEIDKALLILEN